MKPRLAAQTPHHTYLKQKAFSFGWSRVLFHILPAYVLDGSSVAVFVAESGRAIPSLMLAGSLVVSYPALITRFLGWCFYQEGLSRFSLVLLNSLDFILK